MDDDGVVVRVVGRKVVGERLALSVRIGVLRSIGDNDEQLAGRTARTNNACSYLFTNIPIQGQMVTKSLSKANS